MDEPAALILALTCHDGAGPGAVIKLRQSTKARKRVMDEGQQSTPNPHLPVKAALAVEKKS